MSETPRLSDRLVERAINYYGKLRGPALVSNINHLQKQEWKTPGLDVKFIGPEQVEEHGEMIEVAMQRCADDSSPVEGLTPMEIYAGLICYLKANKKEEWTKTHPNEPYLNSYIIAENEVGNTAVVCRYVGAHSERLFFAGKPAVMKPLVKEYTSKIISPRELSFRWVAKQSAMKDLRDTQSWLNGGFAEHDQPVHISRLIRSFKTIIPELNLSNEFNNKFEFRRLTQVDGEAITRIQRDYEEHSERAEWPPTKDGKSTESGIVLKQIDKTSDEYLIAMGGFPDSYKIDYNGEKATLGIFEDFVVKQQFRDYGIGSIFAYMAISDFINSTFKQGAGQVIIVTDANQFSFNLLTTRLLLCNLRSYSGFEWHVARRIPTIQQKFDLVDML